MGSSPPKVAADYGHSRNGKSQHRYQNMTTELAKQRQIDCDASPQRFDRVVATSLRPTERHQQPEWTDRLAVVLTMERSSLQ